MLASGSIDCYSCSSKNGTVPGCDDPMSPAVMKLERRCTVPKENHMGKFPANFCIKMKGTSGEIRPDPSYLHLTFSSSSETTGETLVVRTCVLEDMNSQCGTFKFQNDTLKGCLLTCEYDGCNKAVAGGAQERFLLILIILLGLLISSSRN